MTRTVSEPAMYRVPDAARVLGLGKTKIYELIRGKRLRSVTEGRTRLIPADAITDYLALLTKEAEEAA
ncbi:helix-turn-helix domain-containing protein [Microbispora sp. NBC_01189]|uniref:helix-turn-helix domain-containing protein n=1 Tax=unclassified Microbispora TaxID=2614687 RepID=UPI002E0ED95A|nr:helix-turn-helix domain-containing protein [Microbispora sp. NBC_01189]